MRSRIWAVLLVGALSVLGGTLSHAEVESEERDSLRLKGAVQISTDVPRAARGSRWSLTGSVVDAVRTGPAAAGGEGGLISVAERSTADCLCGPQLFSDGFESGDTTQWSSVVP